MSTLWAQVCMCVFPWEGTDVLWSLVQNFYLQDNYKTMKPLKFSRCFPMESNTLSKHVSSYILRRDFCQCQNALLTTTKISDKWKYI